MKVIELLNKIANGEAPKTILYSNETYWYDARENNYYRYFARDLDDEDIEYLFYGYNILDMLEDEIVIIKDEPRDIEVCGSLFTRSEYNRLAGIKEDKKIEKLESYISCGWNGTCKDLKREDLFSDLKKIGNKINEIIDYINDK